MSNTSMVIFIVIVMSQISVQECFAAPNYYTVQLRLQGRKNCAAQDTTSFTCSVQNLTNKT
jgi:hypothetical protein